MAMSRIEYYKNDKVLFEMVKIAKNRELSFLGGKPIRPIRNIRAAALKFLRMNFDGFHFFERNLNVYYSLAYFDYGNLESFSFNPIKRKEQQKEFKNTIKSYFRGMDFGMDFDESCLYNHSMRCSKYNRDLILKSECKMCKDYKSNFDVLYGDVKNVKEYMDDYELPYQLVFSGKGFHLSIDTKFFKCFDNYMDVNFGDEFYSKIAGEIADVTNCQTVDMNIYGNCRRLWKMPYSFDCNTGNIVLPLSDEQFKHFNLDMAKPENVILDVKNRGVLERPGTSDCVKKFIELEVKT